MKRHIPLRRKMLVLLAVQLSGVYMNLPEEFTFLVKLFSPETPLADVGQVSALALPDISSWNVREPTHPDLRCLIFREQE
jgi:hypothetical protein